MSSVRNWEPDRSEKRALTQKARTNREKGPLSSILLKQTKHEETLHVFPKQASSFYPSQEKSNQSSIFIQTSNEEEDHNDVPHQSSPSKVTLDKQSIISKETLHNRNSKVMQSSKIEHQLKKLEDIKVQYKKIQEFQDERRLQEEAQEFILRLQREKREFEGKLYLIKREQEQKRKRKFYNQIAQKIEEKEIKKLQRMKEVEKRLEQFKSKSIEREEQSRRERAYSMDKRLSKIKLTLNKHKIEQIKVESPTYRIGKKYLEESGRIKKRVKTESSHYYDLTEQERQELDKIREKIQLLTKSMKK